MNSKIVGVTAILATFVILAYAVIAANQNAIDNNAAPCSHASDTAKDPVTGHANENSVLSSCNVQPPSGCSDGTAEGECSTVTELSRCVNGELVFDELCGV